MPYINEMLLQFEGFGYATPLGLNMMYYHIQLTENVSNLCTIILSWGKYHYKCMTVGVSNSLEKFLQKMNSLYQGFEFIRAYKYDLLILTKKYWIDHVQKLELTLNKLE